jgi:hypothetical protein
LGTINRAVNTGVKLVADQAKDEILQLAGQGNLQALSVYLNRHLIPSGAHVKVKQREDSLHVLVVAMQASENQKLIQSVQQLLLDLRPTGVGRAKIYTQVLGQKQANLQQQFALDSRAGRSTNGTGMGSHLSHQSMSSAPAHGSSMPHAAKSQAPQSQRKDSSGTAAKRRYSVAEFLARATTIEELKVLRSHPFFTGICPSCRYKFAPSDTPPVYWDCPRCSWRDDLSSVMPTHPAQGRNHTSVTESKRLGDYLVEAGLLTDSQIEVALADQLTTGLRFGEVLVRRGWIKEETIEYLMQKVIVPERAGSGQNAASYLESSRNLLKALLQNPSSTAQSSPESPAAFPAAVEEETTPPQPTRSATAGKMANERETLILPDMDMDEYLRSR